MDQIDVVIIHIIIGLFANWFLGMATGCLVEIATNSIKLKPPSENTAVKWKELTGENEGGMTIGYIERLLFFAAFWNEEFLIIGAWLTFKVASKWDAWSNVISVPKELEDTKELDYLIARRRWSSHLLVSFQVGTITNIFFGYLAVELIKFTIPAFSK